MLLMSEMLEMVFAAFTQMCTDQLFILFNIFDTFNIHTCFAHNFLNIQWIFNLQKVLES